MKTAKTVEPQGCWRFMRRHRSAALYVWLFVALVASNDSGLTSPDSHPVSTSECTTGANCNDTTNDYPAITAVENELLDLITSSVPATRRRVRHSNVTPAWIA